MMPKQFALRNGRGREITLALGLAAMAFQTFDLPNLFGGRAGLPFKFLIDRENKMVATLASSGTTNVYRALIEPLLRPAPSVHLDFRRQAETVLLSWPATEFGWTLEESDHLDIPSAWTAPRRAVITRDGENVVTIGPTTPGKFFRLRKP